MALAQVIDEIPQAGMNEKLLVVAETVQLVQDRKAFRFVGIERSGKHDAVRNVTRKDFAGDRIALDAAGSSKRTRDVKKAKEGK